MAQDWFDQGTAPAATGGAGWFDDPYKQSGERRAERSADRQDAAAARAAEAAARAASAAQTGAAKTQQEMGDRDYNRGDKLRADFDALPAVKEYRTAFPSLMAGLSSKPDGQGDNALIYAYAKAMDPGSVVRESEMGMASSTGSFIEGAVAKLKKQLGIEGGGQLSPETRANLRREMNSKVAQLAKAYGIARGDYQQLALRQGVNPVDVVGRAPAETQAKEYADLLKRNGFTLEDTPSAIGGAGPTEVDHTGGNPLTPEQQRIYDAFMVANPNATADQLRQFTKAAGLPELRNADDIIKSRGSGFTPASGAQWNETPLSQGLSGLNEGVIANVVGAPVDLANMALNLGAQGVNAIAGTDLAVSDAPIMGSNWIEQQLRNLGVVGAESADPTNQFIRRTAQSVGSAAIPAGFTARTGAQALGMFGSALGGGLGAATAQRVAPGNPYAEMAGELIGSGIPAAGALNMVRRTGQRAINDAVPTIPQLKDQASDLYRRAEFNGTTASPMQTDELANNMGSYLRREGMISPAGRLADDLPSVKNGYQLIEDFSKTKSPMTPTQMEPVRRRIAEGLMSDSANEKRLASGMLEQFDEWASPLAPEFDQARDVASRYLTAQQIERARKLADARASQFSGSGLENALRTEFRALDRNAIKGKANFSDDVLQHVENVTRGTPMSNVARGLGRLAPTGPVSFGLGTVAPATLGTMMAGPVGGAIAGTTAGGLGMFGRRAAESMAKNSAEMAELVARNGGKLPTPQVLTPELERLIGAGLLGQQVQYLQ